MFRSLTVTSIGRFTRRSAGRFLAAFLLLGVATAALPARAASFQSEGRVRDGQGWSGYWWPMLVTKGTHLFDTHGPFQPLQKYGLLTGDYRPLQWEKQYKSTTDPSATWWGHCDGWAASSVLEREPTRSVKVKLKTGHPTVELNVGEIKGLLAACHSADPVDFFSGGRRDQGADHTSDLRSLVFHKALLYYLGQHEEAFVMNITPRANEVWNHPVVAYRMVGQPEPGRPDRTQVSCTIWYADDAVAPDYQGTKYLSKTYTYVLQGSYEAPTAAEWTGQSVMDHPHFAWHPAYAQSYVPGEQDPNPLRYDIVQKIAKLAAGLTN